MIDKTIIEEIDSSCKIQSYICKPESCMQFATISPKSINIMHLNIRSINCNFDNFRVFLVSIKISCEIIILTECWLKKCKSIPMLEGYVSYHTKKSGNQNDGVIMYVKSEVSHSTVEHQMTDASCLVCNINNNSFAVIGIYRSPSVRNYDNFILELDNVPTLSSHKKHVVIMGDINIDITPNNITQQASDYLNLIAAHGLSSAHFLPTRDTSCIDHVMVKSNARTVTLVLDTYITDHRPTFVNMEFARITPKPQCIRNVTDHHTIITQICSTDFTIVTNNNDANTSAELLISTIGAIIQKNTKLVRVSSKNKIIKPWITQGLLRCIRNRDKMSRDLKKYPKNYTLKITYIRYRNFCNKLLKHLKTSFEKSEFLKAKNNPKATWKVIKDITNLNNKVEAPVDLIKVSSDIMSSINNINNFFSTVGKNLADKFHRNPLCGDRIKIDSLSNSLVLLPTDETEIDTIITSLRSDAAAGWDNITPRILKSCRSALVPAITHICNLSMSSGIFPKIFKKAVVHPIFKSGDKSNITNYRPISILPVISKVLEKVLNKRLMNFLEAHNLLAANQYGFRRGKSTEDAVTSLINHVVSTLDSKMKCIGIFLDISKAFDAVSIPHLLSKLEAIGVRGYAYKIFQDYLCDRTQCVKINNLISDSKPLDYGVPQGSVLGSTLFLIYINNLCKLSLSNCSIFTYADDTALIVHGKDWPITFKLAELNLKLVLNWLSNNLLTVNLTKTVYLPFSLQSTTLPTSNSFTITAHTCTSSTAPIQCQCPLLQECASTKYLGVHIDNLLNWKNHLEMSTTRVRKLINIFKKLRQSADYDTLKLIYYSLCQSVLTYCITAWGGASKTHMMHLERAQRAVLKVMTCKPFRYPTRTLLDECRVLSVRQLFVLQTILRKHSLIPYDPNCIKKRRVYKIYPTPAAKTALARRHFDVIGNYIYNIANKHCNIFPLCRIKCKLEVYNWLQKQNYSETEELVKSSML